MRPRRRHLLPLRLLAVPAALAFLACGNDIVGPHGDELSDLKSDLSAYKSLSAAQAPGWDAQLTPCWFATVAGGMGEGIAVRTIRYDQRFDFRATAPEQEPLRSARRIYRDEAEDGSAFELAARLRDELSVTPTVAGSTCPLVCTAASLK